MLPVDMYDSPFWAGYDHYLGDPISGTVLHVPKRDDHGSPERRMYREDGSFVAIPDELEFSDGSHRH